MSKTVTVLYIEDEEDIREMTEFALEDEGFELFVFSSGIDAVSQADMLRPDLLLLDMMMPAMDGITTAVKLREFSHLADIPLIFMTAKVQQSEIDKYNEIGASGVISKPFDAMQLPEQIRSILATSHD